MNNVAYIHPKIENEIYHANFEEEASIFIANFATQCSLLVNDSELPGSLSDRINRRLRHVEISKRKIIEVNNHLNPNKAHGYDDISNSNSKAMST